MKYPSNRILLISLTLALSVLALNSCATSSSERRPDLALGGDTVVAIVNGESIRISQVDRAYRTEFMRYGDIARNFSKKRKRELRSTALQNLINAELLYQDALSKGTIASEERIANVYQQIASRFQSETAFEAALNKEGVSRATLNEDIRRSAVVEKYMEKLSGNISVSTEEVAGIYAKNREAFNAPERVKIAHMLVSAPFDATDEVIAKARKKIEAVHRRLIEGQSFAKLARKHSDSADAANGGEMQFLERGKLIGPLNKAAFHLDEGTFSAPIQSRFGFHLILVKERREAGIRPLDEVREAIAGKLFSDKQKQVTEALVAKLRTFGSVIAYSLPPDLPPDPSP